MQVGVAQEPRCRKPGTNAKYAGNGIRRDCKRGDANIGIGSLAFFRSPILNILIEHSRRRRIAAPLGKSGDPENANATVETDREHVIDLDEMPRRFLARTVDADMAGLDQRRSTGAGFDDPRMPQPFIETLALQNTPTQSHQNIEPDHGSRVAVLPRSVLAVGKLLLERSQFRKRRIRIHRTLALARRAAGVGAKRRTAVRTSVAAFATTFAGSLKFALVVISIPALTLEAFARRTSFALARLTAGRILASRGRAFCWRIGLAKLLVTIASPAPLSVTFTLFAALSHYRYTFSGRRLRAVLPGLGPAMTIAIVARTPLLGSAARPPDLNHFRRGSLRRHNGLGRDDRRFNGRRFR